MPGMNSGLNAGDPTVVAAFRAALLHQGLIALAIFAVLSVVWVAVRDRTANAASAAPQTARPGARRASAASDRLRLAVDVRRAAAGPAEDGRRPAVAGDRAHRGDLTALGAAPGELGRDHVVLPSDSGWRRVGMDSGRDRPVAAGRSARPLRPAGRAGQRGLGADRVDLRRVLRRDLRPRPDLAVRRPRGGADLRRRGRAARAAGPELADAETGPGACSPGSGCSWSAWRYCRPGRAAASGRDTWAASPAP